MISRRQNPKAKRKDKSKSPLFHELHGRQREIINAVILKCMNDSILCIPVRDELIVPFTSGHKARAWMLEEIYKQTGVKAEVGGQRHELPAETKPPCPESYCPECWENRTAYKIDSPSPCSHQSARLDPHSPNCLTDYFPEVVFLEPERVAPSLRLSFV